ncbi:diacylglycerol kinase family protein [Longispora urticae]
MIAVVANPTAGKGRHAALLPALLAQLGPHELLPEGAGAIRAAVAGGASAVVAMGGDGTAHLALQALAGTGVPLGIVPLGTGNDLATGLGLPADPGAAVAAVRAGRTRQVDLARVDGAHGTSWYGSVLAAGFDALVNERANRMRWPRGPLRYDLAIFAEMARLRPLRYRLVIDGEPAELDSVLLAVGNTTSYGGGMRICPGADPADGLLDVTLGVAGRLALATLKPKVRGGTHVTHPAVRTLRARTLEIAGPDLHCYADGERLGPLPVTVTCEPGALTLLH